MIIKLEKVISCTSEHPLHPASNLLTQKIHTSWRCAQPGIMMASVILKFVEPSTITGLDIGNYRSCVVVVEASTDEEPDNWISIAQHQFMTHDEAYNGKFRDQVQLFNRSELNAMNINTKFSRVKVSCMQSANRTELFGLTFIVFKTEVTLQSSDDILSRFKLKKTNSGLETFKEKSLKQLDTEKPNYKQALAEKIKEIAAKRYESPEDGETSSKTSSKDEKEEESSINIEKKQENDKKDEKDEKESTKLEENSSSTEKKILRNEKNVKNIKKVDKDYKIVEKREKNDDKPGESYFASLGNDKNDDEDSTVKRTPFGDVLNTSTDEKKEKRNGKRKSEVDENPSDVKKALKTKKLGKCASCSKEETEDSFCQKCDKLQPQKTEVLTPRPRKTRVPRKPKKYFGKLFEDVAFALSGYVNPQRDEIRKKALKMGARYVADANANNRCTHLICAFQNTPKYQQLKGQAKIVSHKFIEKCFEKQKRLPWRRFALDSQDQAEPESEEEIEGTTSLPNPYQEETDPDSD